MKLPSKKNNENPWRPIFQVLFAFIGVTVITVFLGTSYYRSFKSIQGSKTYYTDFLGNIFYDSTGPCFDVCFLTTFSLLPDVDKRSFSVLIVNNPYKNLKGDIFKGDTRASGYAKDKDTVYIDETILKDADPASFQALGVGLGKDKYSYYYNNDKLHEYIRKIDGRVSLNPSALRVLSYSVSDYAVIQDDDLYYYLKLNPAPIEIMSISRFKAFSYPPLH